MSSTDAAHWVQKYRGIVSNARNVSVRKVVLTRHVMRKTDAHTRVACICSTGTDICAPFVIDVTL